MTSRSDLEKMIKAGMIKTLMASMLNTVNFRSLEHKAYGLFKRSHFHFVFTHPDDEMAMAKSLRIAAKNPLVSANFNMLTDGSHGLEDWNDMTYEQYGLQRLTEFYNSLVRFGFNDPSSGVFLDEHAFYVDLINGDYEKVAEELDKFRANLEASLEEGTDAIFVNDFAGGHFMHDVANFIVCSVARNKGLRVIEYWQPLLFREEGEVFMGVGRLGEDNQGRKEKLPNIPELGIFGGVLYLSPTDIFRDLIHKNRVYSSQKKTLSRMDGQMKLPAKAIYSFREVDLNSIDHTVKPAEPSLYENATWRKRELPRIPVFEDYRKLIEYYKATRE